MITTREQKATEAELSVELAVEQSGLDITVKAGSFKVGGQDYTLAEDSTYTAQNVAERVYVCAYLAWDTVQEQVEVVVDEMPDSDPEAYDWDGDEEMLYAIYQVKIPESTASLDEVEVFANKTVPVSQEGGE